jgi:ligand-binding SRPBCC domain-containing protein
MKTRFTHTAEQWLPYPVEPVFAFFANPENLPRLMPTWQKARIEEASFRPPPPHPAPEKRIRGIAAGVGTHIILSFRPIPFSPIRVPWEAEITEFAWNDHFADQILRGPFPTWNHRHQLTPETRSEVPGTLIRDTVDYTLYGGTLGSALQPLFAVQIASIFRYRQKKTAQLLPLMLASLQVASRDPT